MGLGMGCSRSRAGVQHPKAAQAPGGGQGEVGTPGEGERVPVLGVQSEWLPDHPGEIIPSGPAFIFFFF